MAVTTGFIGLFLYHEGVKKWTAQNAWFLWAMLAVYIVTAIVLICCEGLRRQAPGNYIFLGIFTFATSILVGVISSRYRYRGFFYKLSNIYHPNLIISRAEMTNYFYFPSENSVLLAAGVTVVVCVSLMLFALQTKIDFTRYSLYFIHLSYYFIHLLYTLQSTFSFTLHSDSVEFCLCF